MHTKTTYNTTYLTSANVKNKSWRQLIAKQETARWRVKVEDNPQQPYKNPNVITKVEYTRHPTNNCNHVLQLNNTWQVGIEI
jgi:hypothetical protein